MEKNYIKKRKKKNWIRNKYVSTKALIKNDIALYKILFFLLKKTYHLFLLNNRRFWNPDRFEKIQDIISLDSGTFYYNFENYNRYISRTAAKLHAIIAENFKQQFWLYTRKRL